MVLLGLLLACAEAPAPAAPVAEPTPPVPPGLGAVTRFDGDCAREVRYFDSSGGITPGPPREPQPEEEYSQLLYIPANSLGFVRVRAQAVFPAEYPDNVLGTLTDERWVRGLGPLKNADWSAGIGYAILAEDPQGRRCTGYLSQTVVEGGLMTYRAPGADPGREAPEAATAP